MYKIILLFLVLLSAFLQFNCAHSKKYATVKTVYDPKEKIQIIMMEGNELPKTIGDVFKTRECSLNPEKIISNKEGTYFVLTFFYSSYSGDFSINQGDTMKIVVDDRQITQNALYSKEKKNGISAIYKIEMLDLIEMGKAEKIRIIVHGSENKIEKELSPKNIDNFNRFAEEYVLNVDKDEKIIYDTKVRGFIGAGRGAGYDLWLAYYLNLLNIESIPSLSDFVGIGFGYSSFNYNRYTLIGISGQPPQQLYFYYSMDNKKNSIYNFEIMYGLTHPSKIANWSIEAGISLKYYHVVQKDWDKYQNFETSWGAVPEYNYDITKGRFYEGLAIGIFLQAGSFWFAYDTQNAWSLGLSLPIRF